MYNSHFHQMSAIKEAAETAIESISGRAEIATTEQTELLELSEKLADATAPEEVLERKPKQPAATATRFRGPFDASQSMSTSASDSEDGVGHKNTGELEPPPEPRTLTTSAQRATERRCVECTRTYAMMCTGGTTSRDGQTTSENQPQAPLAPQKIQKRQYLLTTRNTQTIMRERSFSGRMRSAQSQNGHSGGSVSAETTRNRQEGIGEAINPKWAAVEPIATNSVIATPPLSTRTAAKPATKNSQVRTHQVSVSVKI